MKKKNRISFTSAFTLIELTITITLVLLLVVAALPRFSFFNRSYLTQETECLFTHFSYAQYKAIASNKVQKIIFNLEKNAYSYPSIGSITKHYNLPSNITFATLPNVLGPPSRPTRSITQPITFAAKSEPLSVLFFPDGTITSGAAYLVDCKAELMQAITCPIGQVSYIRKYHYINNKWIQI